MANWPHWRLLRRCLWRAWTVRFNNIEIRSGGRLLIAVSTAQAFFSKFKAVMWCTRSSGKAAATPAFFAAMLVGVTLEVCTVYSAGHVAPWAWRRYWSASARMRASRMQRASICYAKHFQCCLQTSTMR